MVEDTNATKGYYIVPLKILVAVTVNSEEENLNPKLESLIEKVTESAEIKEEFFKVSQKISETMGEGSMILIPNLFLPVKDSEEADVAVKFVNEMNERISSAQQSETNGTKAG